MLAQSLQSDPAYRDLISGFVDVLPERTAGILAAIDAEDREEVIRLAHQLKGAGGSYGFDEISVRAKVVEDLARGGASPTLLRDAMQALDSACELAASDWAG